MICVIFAVSGVLFRQRIWVAGLVLVVQGWLEATLRISNDS